MEDRGPVAVTAHCSLILLGPGPPHSKSGHSREPRMSQLTPNEARIESHMAPFSQSETLMKQCLWSEMILHHTYMYVNTLHSFLFAMSLRYQRRKKISFFYRIFVREIYKSETDINTLIPRQTWYLIVFLLTMHLAD